MNSLQLLIALMRDLNLPPQKVLKLVNTAPHEYRHYQIPKRTGGMRDIYHPTPLLKSAQRWLCSTIFSNLPVHDAVNSYRAGHNIRSHAELHVKSNYLLRIDFKDFFPSIDKSWVTEFLHESAKKGHMELEDDAIRTVARLVCRHSQEDRSMALSIGAPSSPAISNAILFDLDLAISEASNHFNCNYTRYADDLYFSCAEANILNGLEVIVRDLVNEVTPRLKVNENKTLHTSRKRRRVVTGITLTPTRSISIGRERKRAIRTQVYLYKNGQLSAEETSRLAGLIAFANDVEPVFIESLKRKYGETEVNSLLFRRTSMDEL